MTALILEPPAPRYADTTPTAAHKLADFMARISWDKVREKGKDTQPDVIPGADVSVLRKKYDPTRVMGAPRRKTATVKIPVGIRPAQLDSYLQDRLILWVREMDKMGWDWVSRRGVVLSKPSYPAYDLLSQTALLDMHECRIRAWFQMRKPEVVRLEIPGHVFEPLVIAK